MVMVQCIGKELDSLKRLSLAGIRIFALTTPLLGALLNAQSGSAQSQDSFGPSFQVAKPSENITREQTILSPERISQKRISLKWLIATAYGLPDYRIVGGPDWINANLYNIDIRVASKADDIYSELRKLIDEKFKLKSHREVREMPIYSLIVAEGGPRLMSHPTPADITLVLSGIFYDGSRGLFSRAISFNRLAKQLSLILNRKVIDKTGIVGLFDINITWAPGTNKPAVRIPITTPFSQIEPDLVHPIIFQALQEQLGLELKPDKGSSDCLVIDSVEKPPVN